MARSTRRLMPMEPTRPLSRVIMSQRRAAHLAPCDAVKQQTVGPAAAATPKVDGIATRGDDGILVSFKWQQTGGTAEQKVPFEVMCLADAVTAGHAVRAFLVLSGDCWKLRNYLTSGKISEHLIHAALVRVVTLEAFVRLANNGQL
jgi:hypothetical protein